MYKKPIKRLNGELQSSNSRRDTRLDGLRGLLQEMARQVEVLGRTKPEVEAAVDFFAEVERFEIELIESALSRTGGIQKRAAKLLGMQNTTLNSKIKRFGIAVSAFQKVINSTTPQQRGTEHWDN